MDVTDNVTCNAPCAHEATPFSSQIKSTAIPDDQTSLVEQARGLGLRSVRAFVPDENTRRRSKGAERVAKHRAKAAAEGKRALHLMVDEDTAKLLREVIALAEKHNLPAREALEAEFIGIYSEVVREEVLEEFFQHIALSEFVAGLTGWRRKVAQWLGVPLPGEE